MSQNSLNTFSKAQFSSIISTLADYSITWILTSVIGFWYVISSFTGSAIGGATNFVINRHWVFKTANNQRIIEIFRYLIVWTGSILLNTLCVYLFTDILRIYYLFSKVITSVFIGVFFNYYFQNTYVFNDKMQ
jgi:putative flippase GtrA